MRASVKISIRCTDDLVGRGLRSVLTPDNKGVPRGLRFLMKGSAEVLEFDIGSGSPSTALSTSLALLQDISLFEQVWLLSRADDA